MSDKYETLYPYLEWPSNEGAIRLMTQEELGTREESVIQTSIVTEFQDL